jgi:hypothetical protein
MSPETAINTALDKLDKMDRMISCLEKRCITQEKTIGELSLRIASATQRAETAESEWIAPRQWRTAHDKTQEDRMNYLKAELAVIKNIATAAVSKTAPKSNEVSFQKHNEKNVNVEGGTIQKMGGMMSWIFLHRI